MQFVKTKIKGQVYEVTLNRPDKKNAFNAQMIQELTDALVDANQNKDVRVVLVSGEGTSFSAGADLNWMKSMKDFTQQENQDDSFKLDAMFQSVIDCCHPVVTYVHGHVFGGAVGLVAASDLVLAEEKTKFSMSEVKLGLAPAVISPYILRKAHRALAIEYMLTGKAFSAQQAQQLQIVNKVIKSDDMSKELDRVIEDFNLCGPQALSETKRLINIVIGDISQEVKNETTRVISECRVSEEGQAGLISFFTKEKAPWTNKGKT